MARHGLAAGAWALAAAAIVLALAASYVMLVPTSTWNAAALFGAIGLADLTAVAIRNVTVRTVVLSAALFASFAMGILTATVGVVLLASATCAFMALRSVSNAGLAGQSSVAIGVGATVGLAALAVVWVAPKILIR